MYESAWTKQITDDIVRCNGLVYPIVANRRAPSGWPDRIIWHAHWHGLAEFKGPSTKVEPVQDAILRELNKRQLYSAVLVREPDLLFLFDSRGRMGNTSFDGTGKGLLAKLWQATNGARANHYSLVTHDSSS